MLDQTVWEECASTTARYKSHSIEVVKSLLVVGIVIVFTASVACDHGVVVRGGRWHGPSLPLRLLSLNLLPLVDAAWHVDADTSRSKLLSADVTDDSLGSLSVISHSSLYVLLFPSNNTIYFFYYYI